MPHKTTAAETETVIVWTAVDEVAEVYSLMPRIWKQCRNAGGEEIKLDQGIRDGKKVARTFLVPIKSIRIAKRRVMTEEQQAKAKAQGRALAASRYSPTPAKSPDLGKDLGETTEDGQSGKDE